MTTHQYGPIKCKFINDGSDVIGPLVAISILLYLHWCIGHAMTTKIESDDASLIVECAFILL